MRKALLLATIALLCLPFSIQADSKKNDTESDEQINADLVQYDNFANKYHLFSTCGREEVGKPWFARLYRLHNGSTKFEHWEEEGYSTLKAATLAVEHDYLSQSEGQPKGYVGHPK